MLNLNHNMKPNHYEYNEHLNEDRRVFMSKLQAEKKMYMLEAERNTVTRLLDEYMGFKSHNKYSSGRKQSIIDYLIKIENIYENSLLVYDYKSKQKKYSLNKDKVLIPLASKGIAKDFFDMYFKYTEMKNDHSEIVNIYERSFKDGVLKDELGRKLLEVSYSVEKRSTGRYYTSNENIVGMSLRLVDLLTVPDGYFLYWADFGQLDLRVAYHTILREDNPEIDEVFQTVEDKYEAFARILSKKIGVPFDLEKFKEDRKHYKVGVLARTYGAGTDTLKQDIKDMDFINQLHEYFKTNKRYQNYLKEVQKTIDYGLEIEITDYFGEKRQIADLTDGPVRKALNTPIQSTSNSIVMHYVNSTLGRFRDLGMGADMIRAYMVRHDEPVFMIHKDCLKHVWILEDHKEVQVDDWAPLTMEHHLGYNYKVEDETLMEVYDIVVQQNEHKLTPRKVSTPRRDFSPIAKTAKLYMVETAKRVGVYLEENEKLKEVHSVKPEGVTRQEAFEQAIGETFGLLSKGDYKYFEVCTKALTGAGYIEDLDIYYKFNNIGEQNQWLAQEDYERRYAEEDGQLVEGLEGSYVGNTDIGSGTNIMGGVV